MKKLVMVLALPPLALAVVIPAKAQNADICSVVLTSNAFNTYNSAYQDNINTATAHAMCALNTYNRSELSSKSESLNSGGQYGMISGFLDAARAAGSRSDEETFNEVCKKDNMSFVRHIFSSQQSQRTTDNVNAWEKCVSGRQGLFGAMTASKDNKKFVINIHYIKGPLTPPKLELRAVDDKLGFSCTIANADISGFVPEDHGMFGSVGITCIRATEKTNDVLMINTSVGELGPFDLPSKEFQELESKVLQLENSNDRLQNEISALKGAKLDIVGPIQIYNAETEIPVPNGGDKARFCALTEASLPVPSAVCQVRFKGGQWMMLGSPQQAVGCSVTCIK